MELVTRTDPLNDERPKVRVVKRACVPAWMFTNTSANVFVLASTIVISGVARRLLRFATMSSVPELLLNFGKTYLKPCAVWATAGETDATKAAPMTKVRTAIEVS